MQRVNASGTNIRHRIISSCHLPFFRSGKQGIFMLSPFTYIFSGKLVLTHYAFEYRVWTSGKTAQQKYWSSNQKYWTVDDIYGHWNRWDLLGNCAKYKIEISDWALKNSKIVESILIKNIRTSGRKIKTIPFIIPSKKTNYLG